ncbi:redoxin family protein [Campylobacter pinnipediorum]|uniref:redoxin family protein n=1 Tax=Campylobacter pinnipediorum TaxID=1965231 RepID=UPI00084D4FB1|nr:redoxin family protein [Campylobacter pinnipediorum]
MKKGLLFLIMAIFFIGCSEDKVDNISGFKEFKDSEEVVLKGVNGQNKVLVRKNGGFVVKGEENKVVVLDIFGTFCPPCQEEAPGIAKYQLDNQKDFLIIGLTHFENVTDEYVVSDFIQKYNAFYFITNDQSVNDRIAEQVVKDIGYQHEIALPFKVILKNGYYQLVTDNNTGKFGVKYYLGGIKMSRMQSDIERINSLKQNME